MDSFEVIACIVVFICVFMFGLCLGYAGSPTELENGCIVHNNKVYCEKVED